MAALAQALEMQVAALRRHQHADGIAGRGAHNANRQFAQILDLLGGRIAGLIRRYGLQDMREDAEQACAIGVHRALQSYDPAKASFSTHVTWQMRGELQRLRLDQRRSARKAGITTSSLEDFGGDDELAFEVVDENALPRAEAGASSDMARHVLDRIFADYSAAQRKGEVPAKPGTLGTRNFDRFSARLAQEKRIVSAHFFGNTVAGDVELPAEQTRQVRRRVLRHFNQIVSHSPTYAAAAETTH